MTPGGSDLAVVFTGDTPLLLALTHMLEKLGPYRTIGHASEKKALAAVLTEEPAFVIIDGDTPGAEAVLSRLGKADAGVPVLVLGTVSGDPAGPGMTSLPKPVSPDGLERFLRELEPRGGSGAHGAPPFNLADYLQLAALGQHSIRFLVVTDEDRPGSVVLERGVLRQARYGDTAGMDALRRLLACGLKSFKVQGLRGAIEDPDLDIPVSRALLDIAVEQDMAAVGSKEDGGENSRKAEPPEATVDPFIEAMTAGIDASLQGDHAAARDAFRRALEIRPGEPKALHNLRRTEEIIDRERLSGKDEDAPV